MSTPRRALERIARVLVIVGYISAAPAAEPVVVVEGLAQPTGLAVREGSRGGVELAIAEAGAGCVTSVVLLGDERHSATTLVEGLGADPQTVLWAGDGALFVAGNTLTAYASQRAGLPATQTATASAEALGRGRLTSLAANDRYVFGAGEGRLWRSRRLADRLTEVREIGPEGAARPGEQEERVVGVALNLRGYLTVLIRAPLAYELRFLDPESPDADGGPATVVTGLNQPIALSYSAAPRPSEPLLYALEPDGVYRIDASGGSAATARRVAEVESPQAMAFGPDGALYVVTADESRTGAVLRFAGEF